MSSAVAEGRDVAPGRRQDPPTPGVRAPPALRRRSPLVSPLWLLDQARATPQGSSCAPYDNAADGGQGYLTRGDRPLPPSGRALLAGNDRVAPDRAHKTLITGLLLSSLPPAAQAAPVEASVRAATTAPTSITMNLLLDEPGLFADAMSFSFLCDSLSTSPIMRSGAALSHPHHPHSASTAWTVGESRLLQADASASGKWHHVKDLGWPGRAPSGSLRGGCQCLPRKRAAPP